ncbi:MAG: hypothetical protein R3D30_12050 [Hyphomicrobiales bacterium]
MLLRQDPPFDMAYITTTHLLNASSPARSWSTTRQPYGTRRRKSSCSTFSI